jgi:hypothetical protein
MKKTIKHLVWTAAVVVLLAMGFVLGSTAVAVKAVAEYCYWVTPPCYYNSDGYLVCPPAYQVCN